MSGQRGTVIERRVTRRAVLGGVAMSAATAILSACSGDTSVLTRTPPTSTATVPGPPPVNVAVLATQAYSINGTARAASNATVTAGAASSAGAGAVYALTNEAGGNAVAVFSRAANGTLTLATTVPTGGKGIGETDDGEALGSQGALILSEDGKWLFACNGGSGDITVFGVGSNGLTQIGKAPSNGVRPISLTVRDNLLYVLNYSRQAPGNGNITAFKVGESGTLTPVNASTRALSGSGAVDPGQVQFSAKGTLLAVPEKATNKIVLYTPGTDGQASAPIVRQSNGNAPFSLAFTANDVMVVADDAGDKEMRAAASSYSATATGELKEISKPVFSKQTAACWVAITGDGKYAYVVNTNSNTISGYAIAGDGKLSLVNADGVTAKGLAKPRDAAFSADSQFLYVLNSGSGTVAGFLVQADGNLKPLGEAGKFPAPGASGLAAR